MLIGVEGAKTPAGAAGQVRPRRRFSVEEAHRPPHGKRSAWNGNQHSCLTEPKNKSHLVFVLNKRWPNVDGKKDYL